MRHRFVRVCAVVAVVAVGSTLAHAESVFTDRSAWESAAGGPVNLDTFDMDVGPGDSFTIVTSAVDVVGTGGVGTYTHEVANGVYAIVTRAANGSPGLLSVTLTFSEPISAVGFDYGSIGGSGRNVAVRGDWDGTGQEGIILRDHDGGSASGFFGVVGTTTFTTITFDQAAANPDTNQDAFNIDNLAFDGPNVFQAEIFDDGFESSNTSAWSSTVP